MGRGASMDYVRRRLFTPNAMIYSFLDRHVIEGPLTEHLQGQANRRLVVWLLLYLEEFMHRFMSGEGRAQELLAA